MAENRFKGKEAGRALGDMLAANSVLKELDLSNQGDGHPSNDQIDAAFAKEFAVGLGANGALEAITFGDKQAVTLKTIMTEVDFSGKELGVSGAIIVAAFLVKCQ